MNEPGSAKVAFEEEKKATKCNYLQVLGAIFCLSVPNLHNYKGLSIWYVVYAAFVVVLLLALFTYTLIYKIQHCYTKIDKTSAVDVIVTSIFTITTTSTVFSTIFLKRKQLVNVVKRTEEIKSSLQLDVTDNKRKLMTLAPLVVLSMLYIASVVQAFVFHFLKVEAFSLLNCIVGLISVYMVMVNLLLLDGYAKNLQILLARFNDKLLALADQMKKRKAAKQKPGPSFLKTHDQLCDIIETYADIFGFPMLCTFGLIPLQALQSLNFVLEKALNSTEASTAVGLNEVALSSTWTSILLISVFMTSLSCDGVSKEGRRTDAICYKMLMEMPARNMVHKEHQLRESLLRLTEQTRFRRPGISAVDCVDVDTAMVFTICEVVVAHAVILMQFD